MSTDQNNSQPNIEPRMRTMRTVWLAMILSIGMYYVFCLVNGRPEGREPNNTLFLVLVAASLFTTLISFLIKGQLLNRAIEQQDVQQVQQAYVIVWAITEVGALLGMIDFFVTGDRYYYLMFIIAACGQLLHFPRREHVLNASFKRSV
jgi:hypothetical protein